MDSERKAIKNITKFIDKNRNHISIIIVSKDFMLRLKDNADMVNIESRVVEKDGEEGEVWFLNHVPVVMNNMLEEGCIIEDDKGEHLFFENF